MHLVTFIELFNAVNSIKDDCKSLFRYFYLFKEYGIREPEKTFCLIEEDYIDENFTDEYHAFYSKLFRNPSKRCTRLHFFDFQDTSLPNSPTLEYILDKHDHYIGYIIFRPWIRFLISNEDTILIDASEEKDGKYISSSLWCPNQDNDGIRTILTKTEREVHCQGKEMIAKGVPFAQQDSKVGACAQTTIWISDKIMHENFKTSKHLTSQITLLAKSNFPTGRIIPSPNLSENGLKIYQMANALVHMGLDPLHYTWPIFDQDDDIQDKNKKEIFCKLLWSILISYIGSGIPVILGGKICESSNEYCSPFSGGHAITAIGYNRGNSVLTNNSYLKDMLSIIVHDDQAGPYLDCTNDNDYRDSSLMFPKDSALFPEGRKLNIRSMLIPMPGKVYMTALEARKNITKFETPSKIVQNQNLEPVLQYISDPSNIFRRLRVCRASKYICKIKERFSESTFPAFVATNLSKIEMPRFIWVCEYGYYHNNQERIFGEIILDATSDGIKSILAVHFGDMLKIASGDGVEEFHSQTATDSYESLLV